MFGILVLMTHVKVGQKCDLRSMKPVSKYLVAHNFGRSMPRGRFDDLMGSIRFSSIARSSGYTKETGSETSDMHWYFGVLRQNCGCIQYLSSWDYHFFWTVSCRKIHTMLVLAWRIVDWGWNSPLRDTGQQARVRYEKLNTEHVGTEIMLKLKVFKEERKIFHLIQNWN